MARSILALALLGMLVFASAERSLLAHKVQGGQSLHAVALTGSSFVVPSTSAATLLGLTTVPVTPFYYTTTGNGTWAPTANGMLLSTGIMGASGAYLTAVMAPGSLYTSASNPTTVAGAAASALNSYYLPTAVVSVLGQPGYAAANLASGVVANAGTQFNGLLAGGVTGVTFPSKTLGVAVGLATASTAITGTITSGSTGAADQQIPSILTTIDGGVSWNAVSGFSPLPSIAPNQPVQVSYPQFAAPTNTAGVFTLGATLVNTATNGLTNGVVPDLTSVFCASKNLCFAAGGFMPLPVATLAAGSLTSPPTVAPPTPVTTPFASDLPSYGQILRSTNGGTYWSYTPMPLNYMPAAPVCTFNPNILTIVGASQTQALALAGKSLCPVPGLLSISSTANGKIVIAVGAPGLPVALPMSMPGSSFYASTTAAVASSTIANFGTIPTPVIVYSSNSGASYSVQQAPVHPGNFLYTLNTVVAIKSTLAFAAGGNPYGTQGAVGSTATLSASTSVGVTGTVFGTVFGTTAQNAATTNPPIPAGVLYAMRAPSAMSTGTTVTVVANAPPPGVCTATNLVGTVAATCAAGAATTTQIATTATNAGVTTAQAGTYGSTLPAGQVMASAPVIAAGGLIIASFNGGYTWAIQTISNSYTYSCTAANNFGISYSIAGLQSINMASTAVAATNVGGGGGTATTFGAGSVNQVTAGLTTAIGVVPFYGPCGFYTGSTITAYSPVATQAANTIPSINSLGFTQLSSIYTGWAVGDSGLVLKTSVTATAIATIATAASGTIITSWVPQLIAGISSGSGFMNLYGIQWDNQNVGYIFGAGVIASTHNGGITWQIETPNNLVSGTTLAIQAAAIVPTNY